MRHHYADVYADSPEKIPSVEHWAIIEGSSVHVPAEGVWAPGHGYPEHNESFVTYAAYLSKEKFEETLRYYLQDNRRVKGIHVLPIAVSKEYSLSEAKGQ